MSQLSGELADPQWVRNVCAIGKGLGESINASDEVDSHRRLQQRPLQRRTPGTFEDICFQMDRLWSFNNDLQSTVADMEMRVCCSHATMTVRTG